MHAVHARPYGGQGVGDGQSVVVVGMEIEGELRITRAHPADVFLHLPGIEHAQGIGQHHAAERLETQPVEQAEDVFG